MAKVYVSSDWAEYEYWFFREEGDHYFYADSAIEIDDDLIARYKEAKRVRRAAEEIEDQLMAEIRGEYNRIEEEREAEKRRIEWEASAPQRLAAEMAHQEAIRVKKQAKKERYFAKYPERREPGWSERKRLEKLAQTGESK